MRKIAVFFLIVITLSFLISVTSASVSGSNIEPLNEICMIGEMHLYYHEGTFILSKAPLFLENGAVKYYSLMGNTYISIGIIFLVFIVVLIVSIILFLFKLIRRIFRGH